MAGMYVPSIIEPASPMERRWSKYIYQCEPCLKRNIRTDIFVGDPFDPSWATQAGYWLSDRLSVEIVTKTNRIGALFYDAGGYCCHECYRVCESQSRLWVGDNKNRYILCASDPDSSKVDTFLRDHKEICQYVGIGSFTYTTGEACFFSTMQARNYGFSKQFGIREAYQHIDLLNVNINQNEEMLECGMGSEKLVKCMANDKSNEDGTSMIKSRSFFSHKLDKDKKLACGTHVYRDMNDDFLASFYHGIVYEVPSGADGDALDQNTLIFTVTAEKGLCLLTMEEFKDNHGIRQAYYDASKSEMLMHRNGTCYKQSSLPWSKISENIETLMSRFKNVHVESKHFKKLFKIHQSIIVYCMSNQESDDMKAIFSFLSKKEGTSSIRSEADKDVCRPQNDCESVTDMKSIETVIALKPGDHVCRKLDLTKGIKGDLIEVLFGYHHGIVIKTPKMERQINSTSDSNKCDNYENYNKMMDNSLIIEMTRSQRIRQVTLRQFSMQCQYEVKKVEYGVSTARQVANCLKPGLFHSHAKSCVETILYRAKSLYDQCKNNTKLYEHGMGNNCEQMAIWCMTGIMRQSKKKAEGVIKGVGKAVEKVLKLALTTSDDLAVVASNVTDDLAIVASNVTDDLVNVSANVASAAKSAGIASGVAVAVEIGLQLYRRHKYLTTFEYTKYDYIMDSVKGWTNMLLTTGTGVGLSLAVAGASITGIAAAGWVLLPTLAVMGGCYGFWKWYQNRHGKTEKEKWYYEYKIDWKCLENLKEKKIELEKKIEDEQLNPDMFDDMILNDKEKQENIKKYLKLNQIIQDIEIDMAYFRYNNAKYEMEHCKTDMNYKELIVFAQLGNSVLRKQIKKEKLHPDLFQRLEITEQEKQRRQAKMETFLEYIENMEKEIKLLQSEGNDAIGKKSKKNKVSWKSIRKMFQRKEKVVLKAIEYN